MTNSFRPQAAPVDTFVEPVSVAPPTDLDVLARALKAVNPGIEAFLDNKMDEAIEDEQQKGIEIAYDELLDDGSLKKVANKIKKKDGEEAARQLIGGSIFSQKAYERTKAKLAGQNLSRNINNNYSSKTFKVIENGQEFERPIHHFSASSPEFQSFLQESLNDENLLQGISTKYRNEIFQPYQLNAIEKITNDHAKAHNEYNFEKTKRQLTPVLFESVSSYNEGNENEALNDIENWLQLNVNLGTFSFNQKSKINETLIESGKSVAALIYSETGDINKSLKAIEMLGQIKIGPKTKQTDGSYQQQILKSNPNFGTKMLDLSSKLLEAKKKDDERKNDERKAAEEFTIKEMVLKYGKKSTEEGKDMLERLVEIFPHRKEFLLKKIELAEADRTPAFKELAGAVISGEYDNNPSLFYRDLAQIKTDIGEATFTDEDEKNYGIAFDAMERRRKGDYASFNSDVRGVLQRLAAESGADDPANLGWQSDKLESDEAKEFRKIQRMLPRIFKDYLQFTPDPNDPTRTLNRTQLEYETELRRLEDFYIDKIEKDRAKRNKAQEAKGPITITPNKPGETTNKGKKEGEEEKGFFGKLFSSVTPGGTSPATAGDLKDKSTSYTVEAGDTLSALANQFKTSVKEIMDANNITDEDFINIGQKLLMPINTIGDALVPESDLQNPSVLDEIDITEPFEYNSLYRLAQEVGFTPEQARIMAAISLAESSGRAAIDTVKSGLDPKKKNEFSLGLWQINMDKIYEAQRLKDFGIKDKQELYNPAVNARAAKILFDQQGYGAWTKYLNGEYKKFLPKTN